MTDTERAHPAGPTTAAGGLAKMIHRRVPHWTVTTNGAAWTITDPDDDYDRRAAIDATTNQHHRPVDPRTPRAWKRGPLVVGCNRGIEVRVQLPETVDGGDLRRVIDALVAVGVLPDEHGINH
ncbi:hypothetical protein QQG74_09205 [Micromonospora sp. FIMYZ51]|uniref:hypothetical protein n=1 Tax=Micromonospora sp. FIMYZ51 TaxID=3051832 RepID=UPI00311F1EBD